MKHVRLLLFALTLMFSVSAIAAPTSDKAPKAKKEHKTTAEKKTKKFASVTYYYDGFGPITSPSSWSTTPQSCPTGTAVLCSITFETGTYPLDVNSKPNSEVLTAVSSGTTGNSGTVYGASHTNPIPANAINYVNRAS